MTLKALSAAVAAVSMAAFGCTQQPSTGSTDTRDAGSDALGTATVQTADGREIKESVFRYYALNVLQKPADQLTSQEREAVLESLVSLDVLAEAAESRGLHNERTIAVQLELQRQQLLARSMINRFMEENQPSEAEIRAEYETVLPELETVEHKARHILVETEEQAQALIEQVEAGADFGELAKEHSIDPAGSNGGDLGWFSSSTMVEPFAQAVEAMEVGAHSTEPVQTQFGWHVILVEDRRMNEPPALDSVRAEITNRVNQRKIQAFIDSLR